MLKVLEILPPAVFFILYKFFNIFVATIGLVIATVILTIIEYIRSKKISKLNLINLIVLVVMSGITIVLEDPSFIKMKVTLIYFSLSIFLLIDLLFLRKFFISRLYKPIFEQMEVKITDAVAKKLTLQWIILLILIAAANEYVWRSFSEEMWVNFKIFLVPGVIISTLVINILLLNDKRNKANQG